MVPEISVYLPNVPGQFSRVLKALASDNLNISGFSVDLQGAMSELRLLFRDAAEAARAQGALDKFQYYTVPSQLLLLSRPHEPGELLKVAEVLGKNGINVQYGYVAIGETESGEVLLAIRVEKDKEQLARDLLAAQGIKDYDAIPAKPHRS